MCFETTNPMSLFMAWGLPRPSLHGVRPGFRHPDLQGHYGHKIVTVPAVSKLAIWQQEY